MGGRNPNVQGAVRELRHCEEKYAQQVTKHGWKESVTAINTPTKQLNTRVIKRPQKSRAGRQSPRTTRVSRAREAPLNKRAAGRQKRAHQVTKNGRLLQSSPGRHSSAVRHN